MYFYWINQSQILLFYITNLSIYPTISKSISYLIARSLYSRLWNSLISSMIVFKVMIRIFSFPNGDFAIMIFLRVSIDLQKGNTGSKSYRNSMNSN